MFEPSIIVVSIVGGVPDVEQLTRNLSSTHTYFLLFKSLICILPAFSHDELVLLEKVIEDELRPSCVGVEFSSDMVMS